MAIIAILATTVAVGFGNVGGREEMRAEAERLALAIELARSEALRRNAMWGLTLEEGGYAFQEYDHAASRWQEVTRRPFASYAAAEGVVFALRQRDASEPAGQPPSPTFAASPPRAAGDGRADEDAAVPTVAILPGGEVTPFDIGVSGGDAAWPSWTVRTDGIQRVRALPASEVAQADEELDRLAQWP